MFAELVWVVSETDLLAATKTGIKVNQSLKRGDAHISGRQEQSAVIYALVVYGMSQNN